MPRIRSRMMSHFPRFQPKLLYYITFIPLTVLAHAGLLIAPGLFLFPASIPMQFHMNEMCRVYGLALSELGLGAILFGQAMVMIAHLRQRHELISDDVCFVCGVIFWAAVAPIMAIGNG